MTPKKSDKPVVGMKKNDLNLVGKLVGRNNISNNTTTNSNNSTGADNTDDITDNRRMLSLPHIQLSSEQPRRYFDSKKLENLADSIRTHGILEPLLVRLLKSKNAGSDDNGNNASSPIYELIAGERRHIAAKMAGLSEVPVIILEIDDISTTQIRLVENLQREDLNPLEETEGILQLLTIELTLSQEEVISLLHKMQNEEKGKITQNVLGNDESKTVRAVFTQLGKISWQSFVSTRLPLLKLPLDILQVLREGRLEYTKAKAIAKVKDEEQRANLLEVAITNNLSLNQIKDKIKELDEIRETTTSLKQQVSNTFCRLKTSKTFNDPKKKQKIEKLLEKWNKDLDKILD